MLCELHRKLLRDDCNLDGSGATGSEQKMLSLEIASHILQTDFSLRNQAGHKARDHDESHSERLPAEKPKCSANEAGRAAGRHERAGS
jgi:hypothetical protein